MRAELDIVAVGARTPIGYSAESSAAAVRAGISRVRLQEGAGFDSDGPLCHDPSLDDSTLSGPERMVALGQAALAETLDKLAVASLPAGQEIPLLVGLPEERPGWGEDDIARVTSDLAGLAAGGFRLAVEPLPLGHAGTLAALHHAHERLAGNDCPVIIVGGVDSYIDGDALNWLSECGQWQSPQVRSGMIPGEGSGFVALMRAERCKTVGLEPLARVRATATARETKVIKTDTVALGEGLTAAVAQVLAVVGDVLVDEVYCDINGERYRSEEWGFVALRLASAFRDATAYKTAVASLGDVGAASGAINLILCTQAWRRHHGRGDTAMIWGSSEGGLRSALLLTNPSGR